MEVAFGALLVKAVDHHLGGDGAQEGEKPLEGGIALVGHHVVAEAGPALQDAFPEERRQNFGPDPGFHRRLEKGDHQIIRGPAEQGGHGVAGGAITGILGPGDRVAAAGDDVLMVDGQAGDAGPARGPGQEILIIGHGHVRLEPVHEVQNLAQIAAGLTPDLEAGEEGGGDVHPVAPDDGGRVGAFLHREFLAQDGGPGIVAEKEKLVLGEVPGNGQGPDGVAVSDAVDPVENFGHSVRTG